MNEGASSTASQQSARRAPLERTAVAIALVLPTVGAWVYFVLMAGHPWALTAYFSAKALQFGLPLITFLAAWRLLQPKHSSSIREKPPNPWLAGLTSGLAVSLTPLALYWLFLRGSETATTAATRIAPKLDDFGVAGLPSFVVLALSLSIAHSFLEEYYFRWFLLRRLVGLHGRKAALWISSLGFMAHHVIVVATYLGPASWPLTVLFSLGIAASGYIWARLYLRTGRLVAPWISHMLADFAIMAIGYDLVWLS